MGRLRLYTSDQILDGARSLVLGEGVAAATIGNIARASGAPPGSIYYRFDSREALLAELWMRAVERAQRHCIGAVEAVTEAGGEPAEAVVAGGLSIFDFALSAPADAQLLVSMRRTDLIRSPLPPPLVERLRALNRPVARVVGRLAGQLFGHPSAPARELVTLAVFDLPYGAVRRHLLAGASPPPDHRAHVERAIRAVLDAAVPPYGEKGGPDAAAHGAPGKATRKGAAQHDSLSANAQPGDRRLPPPRAR
jgi:AcrR family transcriptional regulator